MHSHGQLTLPQVPTTSVSGHFYIVEPAKEVQRAGRGHKSLPFRC